MSNTQKSKPTHRISFARIVGKDEEGRDRLGASREVGSVWPRQGDKGGIIRLDFIPIEMTQHQGVLFLTPVSSSEKSEAGYA